MAEAAAKLPDHIGVSNGKADRHVRDWRPLESIRRAMDPDGRRRALSNIWVISILDSVAVILGAALLIVVMNL
jgi:hypothetical protein